MPMTPKQSFQHTLREISVNRANPCELPRELISNAYDAGASNIFVFPLVQKRGLLFFDDGVGLSAQESAKKNDVVPYVAFFSIGKGTKTVGQQIGYKCQGSKLCFASRRFSVITRCAGEDAWRWKTIDNPKQTLDLNYDLTPAETVVPWQVLRDTILSDADERTSAILEVLGEKFFRDDFQHGTLLIIEDFETDSYDSYFSVEEPLRNYLYNYIRLYSVHGDIRRVSKEHGFTPSDVRAVRSLLKPDTRCDLRFWIVRDKGKGALESVPQGWPYLKRSEESAEPPSVVQQLRSARFQARHATAFKFADRHYSIILAIDGNRRAHEEYPMLGRRGPQNRRSGIALSDIRGALLASNGIVVCQYRQIFDHPLLEDWRILQYGAEHYTLIIDGTFELVTNRDALAPSSLAILRDQEFVKQIEFSSRASVRRKRVISFLSCWIVLIERPRATRRISTSRITIGFVVNSPNAKRLSLRSRISSVADASSPPCAARAFCWCALYPVLPRRVRRPPCCRILEPPADVLWSRDRCHRRPRREQAHHQRQRPRRR